MSTPARLRAAIDGSRDGHPYSRLLMRLLLGAAAILLLVFALQNHGANDPAASLAGPGASPRAIAAMQARMAFDAPLPVQVLGFLARAAAGDVGHTLSTGQPVAAAVLAALPSSLAILGVSGVIGGGLGLVAGVLSLGARTGWLLAIAIAAAGAVPGFALAAALLVLFGSTDVFGPVNQVLLPSLVLAVPVAAAVTEAARVSLRATMRQPYIRWLRAHGTGLFAAGLSHALRNSMGAPLEAASAALAFGMTGLLVVEPMFAVPGLGAGLLAALKGGDVATATAMIAALALIFLLADVALGAVRLALEPRQPPV